MWFKNWLHCTYQPHSFRWEHVNLLPYWLKSGNFIALEKCMPHNCKWFYIVHHQWFSRTQRNWRQQQINFEINIKLRKYIVRWIQRMHEVFKCTWASGYYVLCIAYTMVDLYILQWRIYMYGFFSRMHTMQCDFIAHKRHHVTVARAIIAHKL